MVCQQLQLLVLSIAVSVSKTNEPAVKPAQIMSPGERQKAGDFSPPAIAPAERLSEA
jgi:hypothetical protein